MVLLGKYNQNALVSILRFSKPYDVRKLVSKGFVCWSLLWAEKNDR